MKGTSEINMPEHLSDNMYDTHNIYGTHNTHNMCDIQLFNAIRTKNIVKAEELIKGGADVNLVVDFQYEYIEGDDPEAFSEYYEGDTLLTVATRRNCLDIVKALIDAGADVKAKNIGGGIKSALANAVLDSNIEIVKYLLSVGSEVNYEDPYLLQTPLEQAEDCNCSEEMRALLLEYGAKEPSYEPSSEVYSCPIKKNVVLFSSDDMIEDHKKLQGLIEQVQLLQRDNNLLSTKLESQNQTIIHQQIQLDDQHKQISWLMNEFKAWSKASGATDFTLPDVALTGDTDGITTSLSENNNNDFGGFYG